MNKQYKILISKAVFSALFLCAFLGLQAQVWTGNVDSNWNNPANWSNNQLPTSGSFVTIPGTTSGGNFPIFEGNPIIDYTIQNAGVITFNSFVFNTGTIINYNVGQLVSNNFFVNAGKVVFDNDGYFDNNGIFENYGEFDNAASAVFNNNSNAAYNNYGTFRNFGNLNNNGSFVNAGKFSSTHTVDNQGTVTNFGEFDNVFGSAFNNNAGGTLNNNNHAIFASNGAFNNASTVQNAGEIILNSGAVFTNAGNLTNNNNLKNSGQFFNNSSIQNNGTFRNNDAALIENNGSFQNAGTIDNGTCARIVQQANNAIAGNIENNGGLVYVLAGSVNITGGEFGYEFTDLGQTAPPVPGCKPNVQVSLDENGVAVVEVTDIDKGAYGNCGATITERTVTPNTFGTGDVGQQIVTLSITDEYNLTATCDAIVQILEYVAPLASLDDPDVDMTCPDNISLTTLPGANTAIASWTEPTGTSNCSTTPPAGDCSSTPSSFPNMIYMGEYNGSKYFCSQQNVTFLEGRQLASQVGGYLAVINDAAENEYIRSHIMASSAWIGYTDKVNEGQYVWEGNETSSYTNWDAGQPNNYGGNEDYTRILRSNGKWTDQGSQVSLEAVIEIPCGGVQATCNSVSENISGLIFMGEYNGSKYFCSQNNLTFLEGRQKASQVGGYLAVINDAAENEYIRSHIMASSAWIGYTDKVNEGHYVWEGNETSSYTNWDAGQPNNYGGNEDYTRILRSNGKWTDQGSQVSLEAVIEIPCGYGSNPSNGIAECEYIIKSKASGKVIDIEGASNSNGANLLQWSQSNSNNQIFNLVKVGENEYRIKPKHSNKCLKAHGSQNGTNVYQWDCSNYTSQIWSFEPLNNGYYGIKNKYNGLYLDLASSSSDNGANILVYQWHGGNNQQWELIPVGDCGNDDNSGNGGNGGSGTGELTIEQIAGQASGAEFYEGTTQVAYRASDDCGNEEICLFEVTVEKVPSEITSNCPANIVIDALPGAESAVATWSTPTGTSNCFSDAGVSVARIGEGLESGDAFPIGTTYIAYVLQDSCGAVATCNFAVTVNEVPASLELLSCPQDMTAANPISWAAPTATTTCFTGNIQVRQIEGPLNGTNFPSGTSQVSYLISDDCGNVEQCTFYVTNDGTGPSAEITMDCQGDMTASAVYGSTGVAVTWTEPTATTTCTQDNGSVTITQISQVVNGSVLPIGVTTITYQVTDACGTTTTCSFDITVEEGPQGTGDLTIYCPGDQIGRALVGEEFTIVNWTAPTASTTCSTNSDVVVTQIDGLPNGSEFPLGTSMVTFQATDNCGNVETCTFKIMVTNEPCDIETLVSNISCDDNGTPNNPDDDTFTFDLNVTGVGNPWGWTDGILSIEYDVVTQFGPYNNSDGNVSFDVTDTDNPSCTATVSVEAPAPCSAEPNICNNELLFVVGNTNLNSGDAAAKARMESLNFNITVVDDYYVRTSDANGKGLVVISSTVNASYVGSKFKHTTVPVMTWEGWIYDDMKMTGYYQNYHYGEYSSHKKATINEANHPIAAGLTGTVRVLSSYKTLNWGRPSSHANVIACLPNNESKILVFAYEAGKRMVGMDAPARRVGFFLRNTTAYYMNNEGWRMFDAAILWAAGCTPQTQQLSRPTTEVFDFVVNKENQKAGLYWVNNTGTVNDLYTIEKSSDGINFEPIAQLDAYQDDNRPATFTQYDEQLVDGKNYYRVKLDYLDGSFVYSDVSVVDFSETADFSVFPNPAANYTELDVKAFMGKDVEVHIYNQMAQLVKRENLGELNQPFVRLDLTTLENGVHTIHVVTKGRKIAKKLLVTRMY